MFVFFFKQKTAYEMRISDWSSDVCLPIFFPTADRQTSVWVDAVVWGLHLVRMPLFFLVAGFFAAWVIDRRGGGALARQRVRRIALPFLLAWPLVWLAMSSSTGWAAMNVQHPSAFLAIVGAWMQLHDRAPPQPNTAHLGILTYPVPFGAERTRAGAGK